MKYHCRCRVCQARQVKSKHPDEYYRAVKCVQCGNKNSLRVDKWMMNRWKIQKTCLCGGYWFPHRRGSLYCWNRQDGTKRKIGDNDFKDRLLEKELCNKDYYAN